MRTEIQCYTQEGVTYFKSFYDARDLSVMVKGWPAIRVVEFTKGFAIQYTPNGAYYPSLEAQQ